MKLFPIINTGIELILHMWSDMKTHTDGQLAFIEHYPSAQKMGMVIRLVPAAIMPHYVTDVSTASCQASEAIHQVYAKIKGPQAQN